MARDEYTLTNLRGKPVRWNHVNQIRRGVDVNALEKYDPLMAELIKTAREETDRVFETAMSCNLGNGYYHVGNAMHAVTNIDRFQSRDEYIKVPYDMVKQIQDEMNDTYDFLSDSSELTRHCKCNRTKRSPPKNYY